MRLRPFAQTDLEETVRVWHASKKKAYPWLPTEQAHTYTDDLGYFRDQIRPRCEVWLALEGERIVGMLALEEAMIDRLYVAPSAQGRGVGTTLLDKARELRPAGLSLYTHVKNESARRFYEHRGFTVVRYGVSPPPESEPDVFYEWRPEGRIDE